MKKTLFFFFCAAYYFTMQAQTLAKTPPMGWMTWNYFGENINEKELRDIADAMEASGMVKAGYVYLMIDDGWQGGRDNRNRMIPDPVKFPSGIKALADYVHAKGMKLGIYSDAALLTCAGYTASLHFEEIDAKTFASWGIDYLKYDYCSAPEDSLTPKNRYKTMAEALRKSGRDILFAICEWGVRQPWLWASQVGGHLWRTTFDVRDNWQHLQKIVDLNAPLYKYAGPGRWNDPDMLIVGLRGKSGPAKDFGGNGCSDTEYQTNMSLWAIMASPLIATNDVRKMDETTRNILVNKDVIAINQDSLGIQAYPVDFGDSVQVFVKALSNGDIALAIFNKAKSARSAEIYFTNLGLQGNYNILDCWKHEQVCCSGQWKGQLAGHETKLFRLSKK